MAKGHGFSYVSEVAHYIPYPFKEIVFRFESHSPELNQGSKLLNGSRVMEHEVIANDGEGTAPGRESDALQ